LPPSEAVPLTEEVLRWAEQNPRYEWPGNFRELEQAVKNILVHGDYRTKSRPADAPADNRLLRGEIVPAEEIVRRYTCEVWERVGNYSEAARLLGLDRRTVRKYVSR
jgi:transcriptional regulator of acetoin/glycerol metabolism